MTTIKSLLRYENTNPFSIWTVERDIDFDMWPPISSAFDSSDRRNMNLVATPDMEVVAYFLGPDLVMRHDMENAKKEGARLRVYSFRSANLR